MNSVDLVGGSLLERALKYTRIVQHRSFCSLIKSVSVFEKENAVRNY